MQKYIAIKNRKKKDNSNSPRKNKNICKNIENSHTRQKSPRDDGDMSSPKRARFSGNLHNQHDQTHTCEKCEFQFTIISHFLNCYFILYGAKQSLAQLIRKLTSLIVNPILKKLTLIIVKALTFHKFNAS